MESFVRQDLGGGDNSLSPRRSRKTFHRKAFGHPLVAPQPEQHLDWSTGDEFDKTGAEGVRPERKDVECVLS